MDMKRILQALDSASTKQVEGASDMSKFLSIVKDAVAPAAPAQQPAPAATAPAQQPASPSQDPNFAKYAELMAKYDMLSKEMIPDESGVAKNSSASFIQQVANLKAQAEKLAGQNLQAWEQARKSGGAPQQSQQQLTKQLENRMSFKDYLNLEESKKKIKGVDGKACWDGYKYAGTENGKDKCVKVKPKNEDREDRKDGEIHDVELKNFMSYAKAHYPSLASDPYLAFAKLVQRGLKHSEDEDNTHEQRFAKIEQDIEQLKHTVSQSKGEV